MRDKTTLRTIATFFLVFSIASLIVFAGKKIKKHRPDALPEWANELLNVTTATISGVQADNFLFSQNKWQIIVDTGDVATVYVEKWNQCIDVTQTDATMLIGAGTKLLSVRRLCVEKKS